jgi:hypothetical protein
MSLRRYLGSLGLRKYGPADGGRAAEDLLEVAHRPLSHTSALGRGRSQASEQS